MMKKTILLFITLSAMALAVVFAFTHTYAPQDKILKENVAALAQDLPIEDEEDGSIPDPAGGGRSLNCLTNPEWNAYANGTDVCIRYGDGTKICNWQNRTMAPLNQPANYNCK